MVAKTNVLTFAHDLWMRAFTEVSLDYPEIKPDYNHVDACCMRMVVAPERYDVIATTNMFGDIITDLGAVLQGGMGLAASGNLNPDRTAPSMFEPVHGSAPDIAGQGIANPIAAILSLGMMLDHLGAPKGAEAVRRAVAQVLAAGTPRTPDLGGTSTHGRGRPGRPRGPGGRRRPETPARAEADAPSRPRVAEALAGRAVSPTTSESDRPIACVPPRSALAPSGELRP